MLLQQNNNKEANKVVNKVVNKVANKAVNKVGANNSKAQVVQVQVIVLFVMREIHILTIRMLIELSKLKWDQVAKLLLALY